MTLTRRARVVYFLAMPPLDGLRIIRSSIHGYGMIALRPIYEGDIVVHGDGVIYSENDDFDDTYSLLLYVDEAEQAEMPQLLLDLTDQTRWMNHSCDPNTEVDTCWDPATRQAQAWWIALRDIKAGEELTYDYAFSAHLAEPCACGSSQCRGLIVDLDEIDEVPEQLQHLIRHPFRTKERHTTRPDAP